MLPPASAGRAGLPAVTGLSRAAGPRRAELVVFLAGLRHLCGCTFAELAARATELDDVAAVSATTFKRAVSGTTVPQESTVTAFVRACDAVAEDERIALKLWRAARAEERGVFPQLRAPAVRNIRTRADLAAALAAAYERAGAPPLRTLQERAGTDRVVGASLLPLTTAWRITRREAQPADWPQCEAFLRGCGIHPRRMALWHDAWKRSADAHPALPSRTPASRARTTARLVKGSRDWTTEFLMPVTPVTGVRFVPFDYAEPSTESDMHTAGAAATLHPGPGGYSITPQVRLPRELQVMDDAFGGLGAREQHAVLTAGFTHLRDARARRNGVAPDTGIDVIGVQGGKLLLVEAKNRRDGPPGPPAVGVPALPGPPQGTPGRSSVRLPRSPEPVSA
ncbi:hypothetical protein [Streptomyces mirabilis]|uniref:hypothetical protein n=1 Tax=Streptomyces mirabilis TaxID=68239 RepID=UPI0036B00DFF